MDLVGEGNGRDWAEACPPDLGTGALHGRIVSATNVADRLVTSTATERLIPCARRVCERVRLMSARLGPPEMSAVTSVLRENLRRSPRGLRMSEVPDQAGGAFGVVAKLLEQLVLGEPGSRALGSRW